MIIRTHYITKRGVIVCMVAAIGIDWLVASVLMLTSTVAQQTPPESDDDASLHLSESASTAFKGLGVVARRHSSITPTPTGDRYDIVDTFAAGIPTRSWVSGVVHTGELSPGRVTHNTMSVRALHLDSVSSILLYELASAKLLHYRSIPVVLRVPYAAVNALCYSVVLIAAIVIRNICLDAQRRRRGLCVMCGYALIGVHRCPECGVVAGSDAQMPYGGHSGPP